MSAIKIIQAFAKKSLTKDKGSGITTLPSQFMAESKAGEIAARLQQAGIPINQLDDYIRSEADLLKFLNIIESTSKPRVISGSSAEGRAITDKLFGKKGEVVEFPQKRTFKEEIEAMKKSGDIVDVEDVKISEKITDRDMFKNSNLNKRDSVTETISYIKTLEPMDAMKEANSVIGRKGKYKNLTPEESKKILQDTEDHIFERDIPDEDFAKGGRAGFRGGGRYQGGSSSGSRSSTNQGPAGGASAGGNYGGNRNPEQTYGGVNNNTVGGGGGPTTTRPIIEPVSETVGIETVIENDINPNKFKNYLAANTNLNLQNYLDFQNQFNLFDTNKTYDEYIEMMDNDKTLNPFQKDDMDKKVKEILQQLEKPYIEKPGTFINPEERRYKMAAKTGGRAGYYTGGMVDVEPNLSDIGHGSDALMARTRLVSPDGQATTSTGLNYLLAEDNDNIRVPFSKGKLADAARRKFMKTAGVGAAGLAALKTGLLGFGEKAAPVVEKVAETVSETAQSVPPYFFKLVDKIRTMGDDTLATKDKAIAKKYKDYVMEEDFAGNIEIIKKGDDAAGNKIEDVYMSLKVDEVPLKGKKGSAKVEEYEEFTARPDAEGKMKDVEPGVPDEVVQEGTMFEDNMTEFGKADGGRIGYGIGGLSKLFITGSSRRFLEKVFGKEKFATMIKNDPEMHRGMLEVVEMFRKKDKEGLKMYMQKFLPHMDDAEIEDFIVSSGDSAGIEGQLIRLGSGRDYADKLDMMKQANEIRKLENFDVEGVSKNAEGGRIGLFLGGKLIKNQLTDGKSLLRKMLKFMTRNSADARSPSELLKLYNPKQLGKLLNNPKNIGKISPETGETADQMIKDTMSQTQKERADMVGDLIGSARKIKKVDDDIIAYKKKIIKDMIDGGIDEKTARSFAEQMGKEMKNSAAPLLESPPKITEQGLLELENIQKNLMTKDRKLQATGGLTTMLGE